MGETKMQGRTKMKSTKYQFAVLFALISLSACAPEMKSKTFPDPITDFGPRNQDVELKIENLKSLSIATGQLGFDRDIKSADFFNAAENILQLSKKSHPEIEKLGHTLIEAYYNSGVTSTRAPFSKSPYLLAAIGETQADAKDAIFDVVKMLEAQAAKVLKVVTLSKTEFYWPGQELKINQVVDLAEAYILDLKNHWQAEKLDPRVYKALVEGIDAEFKPLALKFRTLLATMSAEKSLVNFLIEIHQIATILSVEIDKESEGLMQQGATLGKLVDAAKDENDGLRVLLAIWKLLTPEERKAQFSVMSPGLYKYLNGASENQFDCLSGKSCGLDFITILARNTQILPQIKTYGLDKLKSQINEGAIQYATNALIKVAAPLLKKELPDILEDKIKLSFKTETKNIAAISKNLKGFLSPGVDKWAKSFMQEKAAGMSALELSELHLKISSSSQMTFTKPKIPTIGAAGLGASMAVLGLRWQMQQAKFSHIPLDTPTDKLTKIISTKSGAEQMHMREMLSQINKALAMGGFRISESERFSPLSFAINPDGTSKSKLDLKNFIDNPLSFAVPNSLVVSDAFHGTLKKKDEVNVDIDDQAQLLRGLSRMISFFRDWEPNSFDRLLGNVKINDFVLDPRMKSIDQKFFPKDILFTLFIGDAGVLLSNFAKDLSPILLLDESRNMRWENDSISTDATSPVSAMAALVNINKGKRAEIASSEAMANMLMALVELYDSFDGIEKTNSSFLTQKMKDGNNTLDALQDGRKKIFQLIAALANFLTHEMQGPDGGFYHSYDMTLRASIKGPRFLRDQTAVISALLKAGSMNKAQVYKNAALEVYYFMNRKLWINEKSFYSMVEGEKLVGQLLEVAETLNAVEDLVEVMPNSSQVQWKRISQAWIMALQKF